MKHNPDDRRDNVKNIQKNIDFTIHNIELAEEMITKTSDENLKETLKAKNERRRESLESMRNEIKDEAEHAKKQQEIEPL
jgi:small acid-soluble spore protein (thioredoxin-like protein)